MKLADLNTGERGIVAKVNGHGGFRKRIIEMGFVTGKPVEVVLNAPLKDPIEYRILGYKVSLRRSEANLIEVITEEEARKNPVIRPCVKALEEDSCEEVDMLDLEMARLAEERHHVIRVALVGNPNCGKTSLFNIASNSHEHVGNYSGVTVDAKEGYFEYGGYRFVFVDLPGTYSLSAYSPEELYVRRNLIDNVPDVVVNVVDATNLERNLYLTTQVIDMNLRVVMAMNMYDELEAGGDSLDIKQLGYLLGIPICPTVGRNGKGIPELLSTIIGIYENHDDRFARHIHINHGKEIERSIDRIKLLIQENAAIRSKYSTRYLAIKCLENDSDIREVIATLPNSAAIAKARDEEEARIERDYHMNSESAIVDAKYAFIHGALAETLVQHVDERPKSTLSEKIDSVVTNKWAAFPIFLLLLYAIFQATFTLGEYPMNWIDFLVSKFGGLVASMLGPGWVRDLVVDGVIAGVGSVLVFLPNILILYCFLSLMEDSGYMARAAFIVDKLMHRIGLHGKSFIPMIMGFGCNVPAIMATRAIESRKSRLITIAILPFMSCAGRLPVFVLLTGAFFPRNSALALMGIYFLGIVLAVLSAHLIGKFIKEDDLPFVMELPPYRVPTGKSILRHTWEKGKSYLEKMATTILVGSVIIWCLGYFPRSDKGAEYQQEHSYIGQIGKAVAPALDPLGFTWKMDIGLLTGVVAKELVVSTLGVMYAPEATAADENSHDTALQATLSQSMGLPTAVAYMIFILLYFPCIATFVAIRNETGKWRWAVAICAYTMAVAWIVAWLGFHITALII